LNQADKPERTEGNTAGVVVRFLQEIPIANSQKARQIGACPKQGGAVECVIAREDCLPLWRWHSTPATVAVVKTLTNELLPADPMTVQRDGANSTGQAVCSGSCLYRLTVGNFGFT